MGEVETPAHYLVKGGKVVLVASTRLGGGHRGSVTNYEGYDTVKRHVLNGPAVAAPKHRTLEGAYMTLSSDVEKVTLATWGNVVKRNSDVNKAGATGLLVGGYPVVLSSMSVVDVNWLDPVTSHHLATSPDNTMIYGGLKKNSPGIDTENKEPADCHLP